MSLIKEMDSKRLVLDTVTYNTLICGMCPLGRLKAAQELLNEIQAHGRLLDIFTYSTLLDLPCKNKNFVEAMNFFLCKWKVVGY